MTIRTDFYREEFVKHQECLERQREYYSERVITDVEAALSRIITQLEQLCAKDDADQVVSRLLRRFDVAHAIVRVGGPQEDSLTRSRQQLRHIRFEIAPAVIDVAPVPRLVERPLLSAEPE